MSSKYGLRDSAYIILHIDIHLLQTQSAVTKLINCAEATLYGVINSVVDKSSNIDGTAFRYKTIALKCVRNKVRRSL
jgi:hypothetical protein